jgi:ParB-like chromosome segregation protein Spo0J
VVGHTRLLAAQKLELANVPVHIAKDLNPAQIKGYRLMDNRSHEEAKWDVGLLGPKLTELTWASTPRP